MTPELVTAAEPFGIATPYLAMVLAALFTFSVLLVQAVIRWFEGRNT